MILWQHFNTQNISTVSSIEHNEVRKENSFSQTVLTYSKNPVVLLSKNNICVSDIYYLCILTIVRIKCVLRVALKRHPKHKIQFKLLAKLN